MIKTEVKIGERTFLVAGYARSKEEPATIEFVAEQKKYYGMWRGKPKYEIVNEGLAWWTLPEIYISKFKFQLKIQFKNTILNNASNR